jgi:hypothetical protein
MNKIKGWEVVEGMNNGTIAKAWKYEDPTEDARCVTSVADAMEIAKEDPNLLVWPVPKL